MMRAFRSTLVVAAALSLSGLGYWAGSLRRAPAHEAAAPAEAALYYCPMHPSYTAPAPGSCPICGMTLVRAQGPAAPGGPPKPSAVAGRAVLDLSPQKRQLLGIRSEPVRETALSHTIRTVGRVSVDERRVHHVHTKFDGYVERLYVDFTGKLVKHGEPLLSIYSPDLVATQQEYLLAHRARQELAKAGEPALVQGGEGLLEAARQRLLFWDIRPEDIERLGTSGHIMRTLDLYAEMGGYVFQKTAFHGMRVTPADTLFDIADLSHLWVLADVYESDLPAVREGMRAEVSFPYLPGQTWRGAVTYVSPTVEEQTRTVKVRVEIDNRGDVLKPDMFADVELRSELGRGLLLPQSALIDSGDRQLVFVDHGEGRLEPREVQVGARIGEGLQVLGGLAAGERVVTSANFLLDSESSLKAALATLGAGPSRPAPSPAGHQH